MTISSATPLAWDRRCPELNQLRHEDRSVHDWYRFVLSFPPHLVRDYVDQFGLGPSHCVLDPFCGTGTTIVECKKLGIPGVGVEANPMAWFAGTVKLNWQTDPDRLIEGANQISAATKARLEIDEPWRCLDPERQAILLKNSISPLPLHKTLVLLEQIDRHSDHPGHSHWRLALAKALVAKISNLRFGPEVGVGKAKADAPVIDLWLEAVTTIAADLRELQQSTPQATAALQVPTHLHHADSREIIQVLAPSSIDAIITSPPYPNEKDYTRTTRLESVILGFIQDKLHLRSFKRGLVCSNTRNAYASATDDQWVARHGGIQAIATAIEDRRIALGKTSGFERMYPRTVRLYFGGMARHLAELRTILRPGASLAYVVGDQKSYLQVMIRTGTLLAELAEGLGYEVIGIDLFRTRLATATKEHMREEVVLLRWPGKISPQPYPFGTL